MISSNKSIIDNWSLFHAKRMLVNHESYSSYYQTSLHPNIRESFSYSDPDKYRVRERQNEQQKQTYNQLITGIGGISNLINSILFYDETYFIYTAKSYKWRSNDTFKQKITPYLTTKNELDSNLVLNSELFRNITNQELQNYYDDDDNAYGLSYYLLQSENYDAELYVSPERVELIEKIILPNYKNQGMKLFSKIDLLIGEQTEKLWNNDIKIGIQNNFILPSLTHYIFSQSSSNNDILDVLFQVKKSKEMKELRNILASSTSDLSNSLKFQNEVSYILKKLFGTDKDSKDSWVVGINVLFMNLEKPVNIDFQKKKNYITFLRNIIKCRIETNSLQEQIKRLFKNYSHLSANLFH